MSAGRQDLNNKGHSDYQIFLYKLRRPKKHIRENAKCCMPLHTEKQSKLLQKGLKTMTKLQHIRDKSSK
jgi:hypothetical protein